MSFLTRAVDLITWRTDPLLIRSTRPLPSSDFMDERHLERRNAASAVYPGQIANSNLINAIDPGMIQDAETKVATIYACIRLIATAMSEAPIDEYLRDPNGKGEPVPGSRIRELLEEPNPEQSGPDFVYTMTTISAICGYAILEHLRDAAGRTAAIYPRVPSQWKRKELAGDRYEWEVTGAQGRRRTVKDEDVTVIPYEPHPRLKGFGISPLAVIAREAGVENYLVAYLLTFLERGAIIPHVLTTDQPIYDPAQIARMQIQWQQYQGGGGISRPPVLSGGLKVQSVGNSVDDMAWPDLRGITELKICQGWGVAPHLVGAAQAIANGGLATTELREAMRFFQMNTIAPLRVRQQGNLTRGILRREQPDRRYYLAYDTSRVAALQEDRNAQHERERADLLASGTTVDEFRTAIGKDPLPNGRGNVRLVSFNILEQPIDEDQPPAPAKARPPMVPPKKSDRNRSGEMGSRDGEIKSYKWVDLSKYDQRQLEIRNSAARTNRNRQEQLSRQFEPKVRAFFKAQKGRIIDHLGKSGYEPATKSFADIDWLAERHRLQSLLEPHYDRTAKKAIEDINKLLDTNNPAIWDLANPQVAQIWEQLGTQIVDISETTRLSVARIVNDSLNAGTNLADLANNISHLFEETYSGRAMTIARTETQVAYNLASAVGYTQTGEVDEIELHDNPDHDEDYGASDGLTCAQRDGMIVPLGDAEDHIAGEHPNGSLGISPIVRKVDDNGDPIVDE